MKENSYRVVLSGEVAEGVSVDHVVERLATLFKTTESNIDKLFERGNPVVKRNVDRKTAGRYQRIIEKTGALCRIEPMLPSRTKPDETDAAVEENEPASQKGPNVVPVELVYRSEERFKPHAVEKISGSDTEIVFKAPERITTPFKKIAAISAFTDASQNQCLMIFTHGQTHPAVCRIGNIDFSKFPIQTLPKQIATFRNFIYFMCRQHPSIIIDEDTFDFLSGSQPPVMEETKLDRFATALGKIIEAGGDA